MYKSILTVTSPATNFDLTTISDVRLDLELTATDDDAWFAKAIKRASATAANYCNRVFAQQSYSEEFMRDEFRSQYRDQEPLRLAQFPVTTVASVTEDGVVTDASLYELDGKAGLLHRLSGDANGREQWTGCKIVVAYTAGYVLSGASRNVPADLEDAVIRLVKAAHFARKRDPMLRSEDVSGVLSQSWWIGSASDNGAIPPDIRSLLDEYYVPLVA